MPMLRVFEYKETTQTGNKAEPQTADLSGFATKAELDAFREEIHNLLKNVPRQTSRRSMREGNDDAEPVV